MVGELVLERVEQVSRSGVEWFNVCRGYDPLPNSATIEPDSETQAFPDNVDHAPRSREVVVRQFGVDPVMVERASVLSHHDVVVQLGSGPGGCACDSCIVVLALFVLVRLSFLEYGADFACCLS